MRKALMAVVGIRWQVQRGWKASLRCGGDGNGWNWRWSKQTINDSRQLSEELDHVKMNQDHPK